MSDTGAVVPSPEDRGPRLWRSVALLCVVTGLVVLGSINRLGSFTSAPFFNLYPFLHKDFLAMFVLAPLMAGALALLLVEFGGTRAPYIFLFAIFAAVMGASMGLHELTNALTRTGVPPTSFHPAIKFLDDKLSHWTFFVSFAGISLVVIFAQVRRPLERALSAGACVPLSVATLVVAAGVFWNLAFEDTTVDLAVVLAVLAAAVAFRLSNGKTRSLRRLPVSCYFEGAYGIGFVASVLYKLLAG